MKPTIVVYQKRFYVCYAITTAGKAKLLDTTGAKYSGTPDVKKLKKIAKELKVVMFNGYQYFQTKIGVFSSSTGNKITMPEILKLF